MKTSSYTTQRQLEATDALRLGFIGFGSIGSTAASVLKSEAPGVRIVGVLVQRMRPSTEDISFVVNLPNLLEQRPDLVVECAGHEALAKHGAAVLAAGIDLMVVSVGALADPVLHATLLSAARSSGARLHVPAGAIGGLDWLSAAALAGLDDVVYRSRKPPRAWAGSPDHDPTVATSTPARVFFRATVREAALRYPKNVNVAAAVALATIGFDRTKVELMVDPDIDENIHEVEATGRAGSFVLRLCNTSDPVNPRTSVITGYSVANSLLRRSSIVSI
ncbi:aspartate dehydrogenase [Burkholderia lata]|uniref:L-aspartate dehydrogenase n=1 Tax=Burkholderia lata (strain ATCC 17760 / DSM 23089 / LMG 22485 / NCIMB 9086 / R18194 / 383) TaxID=482957 RepID=A0A6P2HM33_BURL3|nr:aspartate dehydrogenase [Burkholderia lata]VWB18197.1 L-aspartate dehydrogenase [Burkholderia lata]